MKSDFLHHERLYLAAHPTAPPPSQSRTALAPAFPLERARLRQVPWLTAVVIIGTGLYGLSLSVLPPTSSVPRARAWIAVPLALHFLLAASHNAVLVVNTTLVTDLFPGCGASATSVNNLVRCSMAAGGVAGVEAMLARLGPAITFVSIGSFGLVAMGFLVAEMRWGRGWRAKREGRAQERADGAGIAGPA